MRSTDKHLNFKLAAHRFAPTEMKRVRGFLGGFSLACLLSALAGCKDASTYEPMVSTSENLRFIEAYPLKVPEPSGLSLSNDLQSLWTASDDDGSIYQIDLEGNILRYFPTAYKDLEGITALDATHLAFIDERARQIIISDEYGKIIRQATIPFPGSDNKGPEALSYDKDAAEFYILKEQPGILLTLNQDLEETARRELKFARDYSGISFDSTRKRYWVLSDLSKSIHVLDQDLNQIQSFSTNIDQLEGLAVNHEAGKIYLISDPLSMLFVFKFDPF